MNKDKINSSFDFENRHFVLEIVYFSNGLFMTLTEGSVNTFGSLSISIKTDKQVNTNTIIPTKYSPIFCQLISEMSCNLSQGIAVVSVYLTSDLTPDMAKKILETIKSYISWFEIFLFGYIFSFSKIVFTARLTFSLYLSVV